MNLLRKLLGDKEYYIVQERVGTKWSDCDTVNKYIDVRVGVATYAQNENKSLRLVKVTCIGGKESRDVAWTHLTWDDATEPKKNKPGDNDFIDTITKMQSLGLIQTKNDFSIKDIIAMTQEAKKEERENIREMMSMMGQKSEDASKYQFYSEFSKTFKDGIMEGAHILKGDDGEEPQQKRLPPAQEEFDPNAKPEIPAFVAVILKYQAAGASPASFLDMLRVMYPGQYADVQQNSEDKLVDFVSKYAEMTSALRSWIQNLYEILNPEQEVEL